MGKFGFHVSIAGGIPLAVERAAGLGCTTMQIFSHSPRTWKLEDIPDAVAGAFIKAREKSGISPLFVHTSYLINLASADEALYKRSIDALQAEMLRADAIGAEYVVTHIGSASGSEVPVAMKRVAGALSRALEGLNVKPRLLLENTAGKSGDVGYRFGEIAGIIEKSGLNGLGVVLDTCHGFAAGYDIKHKAGLEKTLGEMEGSFGLGRLKLIHLNDSKYPLGSRRDRHEHIGKGELGRAAIKRIINHPALRDLPFIMETPKKNPDDDKINMSVIRHLSLSG